MKRTAEYVSLGHPDKTADYISSYIVDRMIAQDPDIKYAVEVMIKGNTVVLGCEIAGNIELTDINEFEKMPCEILSLMKHTLMFGIDTPLMSAG